MRGEHVSRAGRLFTLLEQLGRAPDPAVLSEIEGFYRDSAGKVRVDARRRVYARLIELVNTRELRSDALMAVVFNERDASLVGITARAAAAARPKDDDRLAGVRELADYARECARHGDDQRAGAILGGLADTGDSRVLAILGPCWRTLSSDGRESLLARVRFIASTALPEWLVSWLEECEGPEFRAVAGELERMGRHAAGHRLLDVRCRFPPWEFSSDHRFDVARDVSFPLFVDRLRARLLQLAADESPPRVMHRVLDAWRIHPAQRTMAGIAKRPALVLAPRPLLPLLPFVHPAGDPPRLLPDAARLDDADFAAYPGRLLALWAQFSLMGPVWYTLGVMETEDPDVRLLFFRVLAPSGEESWIAGVLRAADAASPAAARELVASLFAREYVGRLDAFERGLIGRFAPDLVEAPWEELLPAESLRLALLGSPALRELDMVRGLRELREFAGKPWERSAAMIHDLEDRHIERRGPPPREGESTDEVISAWFDLVTSEEHRQHELRATPHAWHRVLSHDDEGHDARAFTFWQLDEFLCRYGYPSLRESSEERAE